MVVARILIAMTDSSRSQWTPQTIAAAIGVVALSIGGGSGVAWLSPADIDPATAVLQEQVRRAEEDIARLTEELHEARRDLEGQRAVMTIIGDFVWEER